jgi:subtilase family serine protease
VTVANNGLAPAGSFSVSVTPGGSLAFPAIGPGGSATRGFNVCLPGNVQATADSGHQVTESNEGNNSGSGGPFACADLVIADVNGSFVIVRNVGNGPAPPTQVQVDGVGTFPVPPLAPGAQSNVGYVCPPGTTPVAHADAGNVVLESDEGNNSKTAGGPC